MRRDLITSATRDRRLHGPARARLPAAHHRRRPGGLPNKADGSQIERDGKIVGSRLIGQDFKGRPRYFQSRPSATGYNPAVTFFNNLGPNNEGARGALPARTWPPTWRASGRYNPGLTRADVPVDASRPSASGVDPHISQANAAIQAHRVAEVRGPRRSTGCSSSSTRTPTAAALGVLGEPGVNVLELNLALDDEEARR